MLELRPMQESDIPAISKLAGKIWREHYPGIISHEQIEFMLEQGYSEESLTNSLKKNHQYTLAILNGEPVGYLDVVPRDKPGCYFLAKFYMDPAVQGQGIGRKLFAHVVQGLADLERFDLRVNRQNIQAINVYFALGFQIHSWDDLDIGNGFVMNDYVMVWTPPSAARSAYADAAQSA